MLLRIADYLDIDEKRAPIELYRFLAPVGFGDGVQAISAKRSVITSIKKADFTEEYKKLLINGINVNIPCGLSRDLCAALKYAESKNKGLI